mgnify:FL=1
MTVKELKALLEKYPDDMEVCKAVYEIEASQWSIEYTDEVYSYTSESNSPIEVLVIS